MLEQLTGKFQKIFNNLKGFGKLTEKNISEALREVRLALLEADVNFLVVKKVVLKIKERALGTEVIESLTPHQKFLTVVHEELTSLLSQRNQNFQLKGHPPHVLMMVGLQGSGKTTSSAKLAHYYKSKGRKPYLVPADVYRPAAIEQLKVLAQNIDVPYYPTEPNDNPVKLVKKALAKAQDFLCDMVIFDTAGRLQIDDALMKELKKMAKRMTNPHLVFVADALTGQEAVNVAKSFHENTALDGLILTKMEGSAKAGALLSIQEIVNAPLLLVGTGEKPTDYEFFNAEKLVNRLLDRGDILSLVDKAKDLIDEDEANQLKQKLKKNQFTIDDFHKQLKQMKKMGSLKSMLGMLPGGRKLGKGIDFNQAEKELKKKEAIIQSMTRKERLKPQILNGSRRLRIARGSGTQVSEINRFLKEYSQAKKMFSQFAKGKMGLKQMGAMLGR